MAAAPEPWSRQYSEPLHTSMREAPLLNWAWDYIALLSENIVRQDVLCLLGHNSVTKKATVAPQFMMGLHPNKTILKLN